MQLFPFLCKIESLEWDVGGGGKVFNTLTPIAEPTPQTFNFHRNRREGYSVKPQFCEFCLVFNFIFL
jgi:hypothetical protein